MKLLFRFIIPAGAGNNNRFLPITNFIFSFFDDCGRDDCIFLGTMIP